MLSFEKWTKILWIPEMPEALDEIKAVFPEVTWLDMLPYTHHSTHTSFNLFRPWASSSVPLGSSSSSASWSFCNKVEQADILPGEILASPSTLTDHRNQLGTKQIKQSSHLSINPRTYGSGPRSVPRDPARQPRRLSMISIPFPGVIHNLTAPYSNQKNHYRPSKPSKSCSRRRSQPALRRPCLDRGKNNPVDSRPGYNSPGKPATRRRFGKRRRECFASVARASGAWLSLFGLFNSIVNPLDAPAIDDFR